MSDEDYLLKVKIQNNRIISLMRERGIDTISELGRQSGINQSHLCSLISMKIAAINPNGIFKPLVTKLADFFGVLPDEMFNEQQLINPLKCNAAERAINTAQLHALLAPPEPLDLLEQKAKDERLEFLDEVLSQLAPKLQTIIKLRCIAGLSLEETGSQVGLTRERVRQLHFEGINQMRIFMSTKDDEALAPMQTYKR